MHPATPGPGSALTAAVIGCGDVSSVHFAAITANPGVELIAVCDVDPGRLNDAVANHSSWGYSDYLQLLDVESPDVVHICTPHHLHAEKTARRPSHHLRPGPGSPLTAEGERYLRLVAQGMSNYRACRGIGVHPTTGMRWRDGRKMVDSGGRALHRRSWINRAALSLPDYHPVASTSTSASRPGSGGSLEVPHLPISPSASGVKHCSHAWVPAGIRRFVGDMIEQGA